eukprot:g337.t1
MSSSDSSLSSDDAIIETAEEETSIALHNLLSRVDVLLELKHRKDIDRLTDLLRKGEFTALEETISTLQLRSQRQKTALKLLDNAGKKEYHTKMLRRFRRKLKFATTTLAQIRNFVELDVIRSLKAVHKFQAKQFTPDELRELHEVTELQLKKGETSESIAIVLEESKRAAEQKIVQLLFGRTISSQQTRRDIDSIEEKAGWSQNSLFDRRFYTLEFADPWLEEDFITLFHKDGVRRICVLLFALFFAILLNTLGDFLYEGNLEALVTGSFFAFFELLLLIRLATKQDVYRHSELYSIIGFALCAVYIVTFKTIRGLVGPQFTMQLLLTPLFGLSRIRFHYNVALGVFVIAFYFMVSIISLEAGAVQETYPSLRNQAINFFTITISGILVCRSHEKTYRRNYLISQDSRLKMTMGNKADSAEGILEAFEPAILPFNQWKFSNLKKIFFSSLLVSSKNEAKLKHVTLSFDNNMLEKNFQKGWYVMDRAPFKDFALPDIHSKSWKAIAPSIGNILFSQILLALSQDLSLFQSYTTSENRLYDIWIVRTCFVALPYITVFIGLYMYCRTVIFRFYTFQMSHEIDDDAILPISSSKKKDQTGTFMSALQKKSISPVNDGNENGNESCSTCLRNTNIVLKKRRKKKRFKTKHSVDYNYSYVQTIGYGVVLCGILHLFGLALILFFLLPEETQQEEIDLYFMAFYRL